MLTRENRILTSNTSYVIYRNHNQMGNRVREGLGELARRDYPGRVIIIGRDKSGENVIAVYAITGRSPSSQARKLVREDDTIWAKPTDEEIIEEGKIELLVYPAVCLSRGIVLSNGRQTLDIEARLDQSHNPSEILKAALSKWDYEPDSPIFTPRISGCVLSPQKAALSIIKRSEDGGSLRDIFEFSLMAGKGKMISTYEGENRQSLIPFSGKPVELELEGERSKDMAEAVYGALRPEGGREDFRVAVACIFSSNIESREYDVSIINRYERIRGFDGKSR